MDVIVTIPRNKGKKLGKKIKLNKGYWEFKKPRNYNVSLLDRIFICFKNKIIGYFTIVSKDKYHFGYTNWNKITSFEYKGFQSVRYRNFEIN